MTIYTPLPIKVTFNANGGEISKKSKTVGKNKKYGKLPKPKRKGYTFKGWYTKKKRGQKVTFKTKIKKRKNHKLYAHWEKKIDYQLYSAQMINLVNEARVASGIHPLERMDKLDEYANIRAKELSKKFSHTRPDGSQYSSLSPKIIKGENIISGWSTPTAAFNRFMKSGVHKENIMFPEFKKIGIGIYKKSGIVYWTMLFS